MNRIKPPIPFSLYRRIIQLPSGKIVKLKKAPIVHNTAIDMITIFMAIVETLDGIPPTREMFQEMPISDTHCLQYEIEHFFRQQACCEFILPSGKHIKLYTNKPYDRNVISPDEILEFIVEQINHQPLTQNSLKSLTPAEIKVIVFRFLQLIKDT